MQGGDVDEIVEDKISGMWSVNAGLKWSMETTDSLPLMFNMKHLLMHLMSLNQPCCSEELLDISNNFVNN